MEASADDDRIAWASEMRSRFSPPGTTNHDGTINQSFFRPERVLIVEERKWREREQEKLCIGLEKYGVGRWGEISKELLPGWDEQQLRLKACKLLGSQSLARYVGWRGSRQQLDQERERNRQVGAATGCWKGGVLVEDGVGSVRKYLEQQQQADDQET